MPLPGRLRMALIGLLIGLAAAAPAVASPQDVLSDYNADGSIDQEHSLEDLQRALVEVQDTSLYGAFRDAVQIELNERLGGVRAPAGPSSPRTGAGAPEGDSTGGAAAPPASEPTPGTATGSTGGTQTETGSAPVVVPGDDEDPPATQRARRREQVREGTPDPDDTADVSARDISGLSAGNELPQPPTVAPGERVPVVFVALSGLAGVLLIGGLASAVYRRTALRRTPR